MSESFSQQRQELRDALNQLQNTNCSQESWKSMWPAIRRLVAAEKALPMTLTSDNSRFETQRISDTMQAERIIEKVCHLQAMLDSIMSHALKIRGSEH